MRIRFSVVGWFAKYLCGCMSEIKTSREELPGTCGEHGEAPLKFYPVEKKTELPESD